MPGRWTDEETETLIRLRKGRMPYAEVIKDPVFAEKGRSSVACRIRLLRVGKDDLADLKPVSRAAESGNTAGQTASRGNVSAAAAPASPRRLRQIVPLQPQVQDPAANLAAMSAPALRSKAVASRPAPEHVEPEGSSARQWPAAGQLGQEWVPQPWAFSHVEAEDGGYNPRMTGPYYSYPQGLGQ